jgi:hypothetical protein
MVVLPVLLGKGIPLFPVEVTAFSGDAWEAVRSAPSISPTRRLDLLRHHTFPDGAVELVYAPA